MSFERYIEIVEIETAYAQARAIGETVEMNLVGNQEDIVSQTMTSEIFLTASGGEFEKGFAMRWRLKYDIEFYALLLRAKFADAAACTLRAELWSVDDLTAGDGAPSGAVPLDLIFTFGPETLTGSYADVTFSDFAETLITKGDYVWIFWPKYTTPGASPTTYLEVAVPNAETFAGHYGYRDNMMEFATWFCLLNKQDDQDFRYVRKVGATRDGSSETWSDTTGVCPIKTLNAFVYKILPDYELPTGTWTETIGPDLAGRTPTENGQLRIDQTKVIGTDVTFDVYGATREGNYNTGPLDAGKVDGAVGSGVTSMVVKNLVGVAPLAGEVVRFKGTAEDVVLTTGSTTTLLQFASATGFAHANNENFDIMGPAELLGAVDGDTLPAFRWWLIRPKLMTAHRGRTPSVRAATCYFPVTKRFTRRSVGYNGYAAIVADIVPAEATLNPMTGESSLSKPSVDLLIQKEGAQKTDSYVEQLIRNNWALIGGALRVKIIQVDKYGVEAAPVQLFDGTIADVKPVGENQVQVLCDDALVYSRDPLRAYAAAGQFTTEYYYENPIDILRELISRGGFPDRLLEVSTFDAFRTEYASWQFYNQLTCSYDETWTKVYELLELTETLSLVPNGSTGKLELRKLFRPGAAAVAEWDDNNSRRATPPQMNFDKRLSVVFVQRGHWKRY